MQIVIDIPQITYNHVFDNTGISNNDLRNILLSISNSVILPDGHGRLIDADALPLNDIDDANYGSNYIRIAPTIIEADKGGD